MKNVLVIGADGYVASHIVDHAISAGHNVIAATRRNIANAAQLDDIVRCTSFDQVVCLPQLTRDGVDWILDRVDGPRWVVFSSAQLGAATPAPGTEIAVARERLAVERGAVVLRPTMIFGHGGDLNVTRLARTTNRTKVPLLIGGGHYLVQPVHVDDVVGLIALHLDALESREVIGGVYPVGGSEAVPANELLVMITEILGVRTPALNIAPTLLHLASRLAPFAGLRQDQVLRLTEDKTVDNTLTRVAFDWEPGPLAHRIELGVGEALCLSRPVAVR